MLTFPCSLCASLLWYWCLVSLCLSSCLTECSANPDAAYRQGQDALTAALCSANTALSYWHKNLPAQEVILADITKTTSTEADTLSELNKHLQTGAVATCTKGQPCSYLPLYIDKSSQDEAALITAAECVVKDVLDTITKLNPIVTHMKTTLLTLTTTVADADKAVKLTTTSCDTLSSFVKSLDELVCSLTLDGQSLCAGVTHVQHSSCTLSTEVTTIQWFDSTRTEAIAQLTYLCSVNEQLCSSTHTCPDYSHTQQATALVANCLVSPAAEIVRLRACLYEEADALCRTKCCCVQGSSIVSAWIKYLLGLISGLDLLVTATDREVRLIECAFPQLVCLSKDVACLLTAADALVCSTVKEITTCAPLSTTRYNCIRTELTTALEKLTKDTAQELLLTESSSMELSQLTTLSKSISTANCALQEEYQLYQHLRCYITLLCKAEQQTECAITTLFNENSELSCSKQQLDTLVLALAPLLVQVNEIKSVSDLVGVSLSAKTSCGSACDTERQALCTAADTLAALVCSLEKQVTCLNDLFTKLAIKVTCEAKNIKTALSHATLLITTIGTAFNRSAASIGKCALAESDMKWIKQAAWQLGDEVRCTQRTETGLEKELCGVKDELLQQLQCDIKTGQQQVTCIQGLERTYQECQTKCCAAATPAADPSHIKHM